MQSAAGISEQSSSELGFLGCASFVAALALAVEPCLGEIEALAAVAWDRPGSCAASDGRPSCHLAVASAADLGDPSAADLDLLDTGLRFVLEVCCCTVLVLLVYCSRSRSSAAGFSRCTE